jgi:hypothetical protein
VGTVVRLDRRVHENRSVPAYRLAEAGMEVTARTAEVRRGVEDIARHAWATRDPWTLQRISRLIPSLAALDGEGKRIAGWGEESTCADGITGPGHGSAVAG